MLTIEATLAWKCLNGVVCVYKPSSLSMGCLRKILAQKLTTDLNSMECREPRKYVHISGNTTEPLHVDIRTNYADHPLIVGPRYLPNDVKINFVKSFSPEISGVCVLGINEGQYEILKLRHYNPLCTYRIIGELGKKTDNEWAHGKILYKYNYEYIKKSRIDHVASSVQLNYQKQLVNTCGHHPSTQEAYETIASGIIRPVNREQSVCYSIKCIDMNLPYFTLELVTINETTEFLLSIVSEIGHRLRNMAVTSSIRCIRDGFFTVNDALLKKHWHLQYVLDNMKHSKDKLGKNEDFGAFLKKLDKEDEPFISENVDNMEEESILADELMQENELFH